MIYLCRKLNFILKYAGDIFINHTIIIRNSVSLGSKISYMLLLFICSFE